MKLSRKAQYALLVTIYLSRSGLARTQDVAANLNLPQSFIEQITRNLRNAGIIVASRGPGGGYAIKAGTSPTVAQVLAAVGVRGFLSPGDTLTNSLRGTEGRTLNHLVGLVASSTSAVLNQPISQLTSELVSLEVRQLNSVSATSSHS